MDPRQVLSAISTPDAAVLFSRLRSHKYRALATFGVDAATPFDELNDVRSKIVSAASTLIRLGPDRDTPQRQKFEAIIWEGETEADELKARIAKIVAEAEKLFGREARHP